MKLLLLLATALISYLLGCVNAAFVYSKKIKHTDIRSYGSGNAGSTNVLRVYGIKPAFIVFLCDMLKGFLAIKLCILINGRMDYALIISAVCVVCGHNWPAFIDYRGGKGVATTFGVSLALCPMVSLAALCIALVLVIITRMMSVGTVGAVVLSALYLLVSKQPYYISVSFSILAILCVYQHSGNIKRIINGTENKLDFRKKD